MLRVKTYSAPPGQRLEGSFMWDWLTSPQVSQRIDTIGFMVLGLYVVRLVDWATGRFRVREDKSAPHPHQQNKGN